MAPILEDTARTFKVLVIGGSYGGLSAALNLQDLCRGKSPRCGPAAKEGDAPVERPQFAVDITIVDERDGFYHLIGSPLALASEAYAEKAWVKFEDIPALQAPNIRVLQGSVQSVDPETKTAIVVRGNGSQATDLHYDFLVAAAGLRRAWPVVPQSLRKKQYLFEAGDHIRAATKAKHGVVIVGGGAVGIEMAAELKLVRPELKVTLVHSRDKLLSAEPLPDSVKDESLKLVREANVDVLLSHRLDRAEEITDDVTGADCLRLHFTNGHLMLADQVSLAVSKSVPSTRFLPQNVLDEEGYVKVQASLAFPEPTPNAADHLALGDMIRWSGIKRCGAAMHMGYFAAHNLHQRMQDKSDEFLSLAEIPPMIGLAVGKKAVSYWPGAGVSSGEDVMKAFFGDDLGFTICWNHLGLGGDKITA
ncbi:pyridine nucleotide-disulfide oxidoreductase-like protein [Podospora didyma]|uniref:Pyridine nucleotide-disulfide oxidoreductase-like protein n=1 Tax=Podospora didyma TaxID=330526 RepID=A0AAE0NNL5_9PEZI|nr:pyridine nucleotide-disulfide oxidoreductase-like protein [Podospora didyma]